MKLPDAIREQFRRYGRAGGHARAAKMSSHARAAVGSKAATARWLKTRFGSASFAGLGLPGGEVIDAGLADLADGRVTIPSLLVSLAARRLRREGVPVGRVHAEPEEALFRMIAATAGDLSHARYNAYRRQVVSFADSCRRARIDGAPRAT